MATQIRMDQLFNHAYEFDDGITPEEQEAYIAQQHAKGGEFLAKQGWGQELFRAAQPFVQQAAGVGAGAGQASTLAPYGAKDVFGLGTQQVTQLQQNYQQDQVHQQKTAQEERASFMQQQEQEKDRALRLKVLSQKEKNDKVQADLDSRRVTATEKGVELEEKKMNQGQVVTAPDGSQHMMTWDKDGNPVVDPNPFMEGVPEVRTIGDKLYERSSQDGKWHVVASNPNYGRSSGGSGGGGASSGGFDVRMLDVFERATRNMPPAMRHQMAQEVLPPEIAEKYQPSPDDMDDDTLEDYSKTSAFGTLINWLGGFGRGATGQEQEVGEFPESKTPSTVTGGTPPANEGPVTPYAGRPYSPNPRSPANNIITLNREQKAQLEAAKKLFAKHPQQGLDAFRATGLTVQGAKVPYEVTDGNGNTIKKNKMVYVIGGDTSGRTIVEIDE